jgi:hypothetical protein
MVGVTKELKVADMMQAGRLSVCPPCLLYMVYLHRPTITDKTSAAILPFRHLPRWRKPMIAESLPGAVIGAPTPSALTER